MSTWEAGPGRPSTYPFEFPRHVVAMVLEDGRSIVQAARSLGINDATIGNWVARERDRMDQGRVLSVDERVELAELRIQLPRCRWSTIYSITVAVWVKESAL
jgi:transposase